MKRGKIWNDDDTASLRNLTMLGRTDREIARILGFTRETILRRRALQGVGILETAEARRAAQLRGRIAALAGAERMRKRCKDEDGAA